jgi:DNA-binding response OmpR family regulator
MLLVEDDMRLASAVLQYLELHDIICDHCPDGNPALALVEKNTYDVIVSDVNMGRMPGFEFCRTLRSLAKDTPFILVTSRTSLDDKIEGFSSGADDYLTKPFELKELHMRIQALVTRARGLLSIIQIEELGLTVNTAIRTVTRNNKVVTLSKSNWQLLLSLANAWPNPVSKQDLEFAIWGEDPPDSNGLKAHIHLLRQRLDKPFDIPFIHAVANFGYVLVNKSHDT